MRSACSRLQCAHGKCSACKVAIRNEYRTIIFSMVAAGHCRVEGQGQPFRRSNSYSVKVPGVIGKRLAARGKVWQAYFTMQRPFHVLCSTSLFVACCEALLGKKLHGVRRRPTSAQERADNIQVVLWELSHGVLQTDLSHISGHGVVSGTL